MTDSALNGGRPAAKPRQGRLFRGRGDRLSPSESVLPPGGLTGRSLVLVVAAMAFLAALGLAALTGLAREARGWADMVGGHVTVQVRASGHETPQRAIDRVVALLRATPGVTAADPVPMDEVTAQLETWLGTGNVTGALPVPYLIDVAIDREAPPDFEALAAAIEEAAPEAQLDTHGQWRRELTAAAIGIEAIGFAIVAIVVAAMVAVIVFATRAGLRANHEVVEALHLMGARDRFVAHEVERHFLALGFKAGIAGAVLAALVMIALEAAAGERTSAAVALTAGFAPGLEGYLMILAVPLITAAVTVVTARITVLRTLARMP